MKVSGHCSAEQLKESFGESCPARVSLSGGPAAPPGYCACMRDYLGTLSDEEVAALGLATAGYAPAAAEAKRRGLARPEMPAPLQRYVEAEKTCKTP